MDDFRELEQAAKQGDSTAQTHLAAIIAKSGEAKDLSNALYWYLEAVRSGYVDAMWDAGIMLMNGEGGVENREFGLHLIRIAAQNRNTSACLYLANCYENGLEGLEKNSSLASQWNQNAWDIDNQHDFVDPIDVDALIDQPEKPNSD